MENLISRRICKILLFTWYPLGMLWQDSISRPFTSASVSVCVCQMMMSVWEREREVCGIDFRWVSCYRYIKASKYCNSKMKQIYHVCLFRQNGYIHRGKKLFYFIGVGSLICVLRNPFYWTTASSEEPDQTPQSAASNNAYRVSLKFE